MPECARPEVSPARRRVLLATADLAQRQAWYAALSGQGLSVATIASGEQAAQVFAQDPPQLLIVSMRLADMTGWELVRRIRTFDAHLPIIVLGPGTDAPADRRNSVQAYLPDTTPPEALAAVAELCLAAIEPPNTARTVGTVLLVDDEPRLRDIVREFLQLHGFLVHTADSGEAALDALGTARPKAVLLDIRMAGMDGLVTLKKLREADPALPVIIITSADDEATRCEALALGARQYVLKPLNFDHLKDLLVGVMLAPNDRPAFGATPGVNTRSPVS